MTSPSRSNVFQGGAQVFIDEADIGILDGPVSVDVERVLGEQVGEPYGPSPYQWFREGDRVTVTVPMAETHRENMEIVLGTHGGANYGYLEDRPGTLTSHTMRIQPVADVAGGETGKAGDIDLYAVVQEGPISVLYDRAGKRVFTATFRAGVDPSRPAGRRIGCIHRPDEA